MPRRRRRKRHGTSSTADVPTADAHNRMWAVDFQFDVTTDGRPIKIVSIIDEHTRVSAAWWSAASRRGPDHRTRLPRRLIWRWPGRETVCHGCSVHIPTRTAS